MDHAEAVRLKATEKYLLGELTAGLREQYEEHYFSCPECALDVKTGAVFLESTREALRSEALPGKASDLGRQRSRWLAWLQPAFAVPALAVLFAVSAYQNLVTIPGLKNHLSKGSTPQILTSFSLITQNSRGGTPAKVVVNENRPFSLFVDIPPEGDFPAYTCQILDERGGRELSVRVSKEDARNTIQLLIPASRLRAGAHTLVIRGGSGLAGVGEEGREVARYPFTLEIKHY